MRLLVILGSTRPGRVGSAVAQWVTAHPRAGELFERVELVDLAERALPFLDEPNHPKARAYTRDHTRAWSAVVDRADAFLLVTSEYNLAPPPPLTNAIDYLHEEWRWKAAAIASYGGPAGGVRSGQVLKQMLASMNCFTVHEGVMVPVIAEKVSPDGVFSPPPGAHDAATRMLDALHTLAAALRGVRCGEIAAEPARAATRA